MGERRGRVLVAKNIVIALPLWLGLLGAGQAVAVNNVAPGLGDGRLKLDEDVWGTGVNLRLLYELSAIARFSLTHNPQADLDFKASVEFSNLAPGLEALLSGRGLLNAIVDLGIKVPEQAMASAFHQMTPRWAILGSLGWQHWSKFGEAEVVGNSDNPTGLGTDLEFDDTWHTAAGAQLLERGVSPQFQCGLRLQILERLDGLPDASAEPYQGFRGRLTELGHQDVRLAHCRGVRLCRGAGCE